MDNARRTTQAFAAVTTLFFSWGFITSVIDPLVAAVKHVFSLTNVEAQLSAFAFFIAYGLVSLPAASLIAKIGQARAIILALALMAGGCLVILAAADLAAYAGVLAGLFLLAGGITILQVAANPLAAALGAPERSHLRLVLAQAFNSLGTVLGPLVGARFLLRGLDVDGGTAALGQVGRSFLTIAGLLVALMLFVWAMRGRLSIATHSVAPAISPLAVLREAISSPWALAGAAAIFLYVGAEVAIGSQMALFLHDPAVWGIALERAGYFVSLYWLGAMIGRFAGSALLVVISASRLLGLTALGAAVLSLIVLLVGGVAGGWVALAIGLMNAIMFPVIFTLTLERSTASAEATAGLLCTAIVGGAFVPLAMATMADRAGYVAAFVIPIVCYVLLLGFAWAAGRVTSVQEPATPVAH